MFLRDGQRRWYVLSHRLHVDSDPPPSLEEMWSVISALSRPWILYRGSSSLVPEHTRGHHGLLVEEEEGADAPHSQSNKVKCVEIQSHVFLSQLPTEMNQIILAAYSLAQELASSPAARRLEDLFETGPPTDLTHPVYHEACQGVDLEIQRLSRSPFAMDAISASGNVVNEREINGLNWCIERIYRGLYVEIEEYAPGDRRWCVD